MEEFHGQSDRVATVRLRIHKIGLSIIQVYAPTSTAIEEEMDKFYEDLEETMDREKKKTTYILVIGDYNSKIGQRERDDGMITGQYGYGTRNERGRSPIGFAIKHRLFITNTFFKKRNNRKWTWISPNGAYKNEIDYILSNNREIVMNTEVINQLEFETDHRMIRSTISINKDEHRKQKYGQKLIAFQKAKE